MKTLGESDSILLLIYNPPELDELFNKQAILWAINYFDKYKSPGTDEFIPIMVIHCWRYTKTVFTSIIFQIHGKERSQGSFYS